MYTDNSRWSRLFVLLSLLSTGLSIVAAGLLFDYSSHVLNQSELFDSRTEGVPVVSGSRVVDADHLRGYAPGRSSFAPTARPVRLGENAGRAALSGVGNSILVDALHYKIAAHVKSLRRYASPDLIVLEPAAPDIKIRNVFHTAPQSIHAVPGSPRKGHGG